MTVIENPREQAKLIEKLQSFNKSLKFLHQISQDISTVKPLSQLLIEIMESSKILMQAEASSLLLYDENDHKLHFHVATGEKGQIIKQFSIELGEGIAGWVAKHGKALLIEDCYKDPRFNPEYDKRSNFITRSMICVPLMRKDRLLGVIQVINKKNGVVFEPEDLNLFETLASQCAIAIENQQLTQRQIKAEALKRELETAREIQQHLLPETLPEFEDLDIAAIIIPAHEVGGDYYNVIKINDKETLFFIADVSGKGIPAALIVSIIVACLNSSLLNRNIKFELMELVITMNRVLIESTTSTKFVTAWFGLYNHAKSELTSLNAGHNPPYLLKHLSNDFIALHKGGIFLGALDLPFETEIVQMEKDDILVYFSDGVTEAWNIEEEDYGEERLRDVILQAKGSSADDVLEKIQKDVKLHTGSAEPSDDLTCCIMIKNN
ncbi:SpoIIE family protein phosphatase [bacterium]|nr:SpoIIE family protein phosphatase [bacterium]